MRVQIEIPDGTPKAVIHISVRITDINYGNHLGNDAIVSIIHEARVQFLGQHGFSELDAGGTALIMGDLAVQFKNEAFYGDNLAIEIYSSSITKVSFALTYKITTTRNEKKLTIAVATTNMVCYNYSLRKISSITPHLLDIL